MEISVGMRSATSSKGIRGAIFGNMKMTAKPIIAVRMLKTFTV